MSVEGQVCLIVYPVHFAAFQSCKWCLIARGPVACVQSPIFPFLRSRYAVSNGVLDDVT